MNIWIIPALVWSFGCFAVAGWALTRMYDYKAQVASIKLEDIEERSKLASDLSIQVQARAALQVQSDTFHKQAEEAAESLLTCMEEREALQLKLDEALKPRTRGKARMSQERGRDV